MCPVLVLRPVGGITERFRTARKLTHVGFLSGVRPEVGLQILKAGIGLGAAFKLSATKRGYGSYYYRYQISENIIQSFYPWQWNFNFFNRRVISTKQKILFFHCI